MLDVLTNVSEELTTYIFREAERTFEALVITTNVEVPDSNLDLEIGYPEEFHGILHFFQADICILPEISLKPLSHPLYFFQSHNYPIF
jgi:hypothetical protein